jgi:hypothetical protein
MAAIRRFDALSEAGMIARWIAATIPPIFV